MEYAALLSPPCGFTSEGAALHGRMRINRRPSDVGIRDRWRNGVKATIRTQIDDTCLLTDAKGLCGTTDILQDSLAYLSTESGEDITACEGARMWVQEEYLDTLFSLLKP